MALFLFSGVCVLGASLIQSMYDSKDDDTPLSGERKYGWSGIKDLSKISQDVGD